jgi:hypothetical protein
MSQAQKTAAKMTAICRRTITTTRLMLSESLIGVEIMSVETNTGGLASKRSERFITAVQAWNSRCSLTRCNFELKLTGDDTTAREVLTEFRALDPLELAEEFLEAKALRGNKRTCRDKMIVNAKPELMAALRAGSEGVSTIKFAADDNHVSIYSIDPSPSLLTLRSYNVLTGALVEVSLKEWIMGLFGQRSLVIHGNAQCAKTPVARALCALLAGALQKKSGKAPFYLKVGTADSLRDAQTAGLMQPNVPILFDEVTPGAPRGSRPAMGCECVKHMTDVIETTCLDGRMKDITFACPQPRIFTSNAATPHEWFHELPRDIFVQTDVQRLAQCANTAAIFKRTFFLHVTECLIPPAVRAAFEAQKLAGYNATMLEFLGQDIP